VDLIHNDTDPSPVADGTQDVHGTAVVGLGSATANNNEGIAGIAYGAGYGVIQAMPASNSLNGNDTEGFARLAAGLRYSKSDLHIDVKNFSIVTRYAYGPLIFSHWKDLETAASEAAKSGTLVVVSAGNDMNKHGVVAGNDGNATAKFISGPEVFMIGAITHDNKPAVYSDVGSSIIACAPSGDTTLQGGATVPSTDRTGIAGYNPSQETSLADQNYAGFSGTSAAAPQVAACLALAGEAHNQTFGDNLTGLDKTRYYQHLVAESSSLEGIQLT
jgi:serine protease